MKMRKKIERVYDLLKEVTGIQNIYYRQPSTGMIYPCIKFNWKDIKRLYANNKVYLSMDIWEVIVIDEDADSDIPYKLLEIPKCSMDRTYQSNGLNHFIFTLYK